MIAHFPLPEIGALSAMFFSAFYLKAKVTERKFEFILIAPMAVLSVFILKYFSPIPLAAASLFYAFIFAKPKTIREKFAEIAKSFRLAPGLLAASFFYGRLDGLGFIIPFIVVAVFLTAYDYVSSNINAKTPPIEKIDGLLTPVAIPLYFSYAYGGVQMLFLMMFPLIGALLLVKLYFQESAERRQFFDLLNVANELISSALNLSEMVEKVVGRVAGIFAAESVDLFLKVDGSWKLANFSGNSPWESSNPDPEFFAEVEKKLPNAPLFVADIASEEPYRVYARKKLACLLLIPLGPADAPNGFLLCAHGSPGHFHAGHLEFSKVLVGQLSSALLGSQLHDELEETLKKLRDTQAQLVHSEKMAGLGKLVSGVAHELSSPLLVLSTRLPEVEAKAKKLVEIFREFGEMEKELPEEAKPILADLEELKTGLKINDLPQFLDEAFKSFYEAAGRSKTIVEGLQTFAKTGESAETREESDLHAGIDSTLRLLIPMHDPNVMIEKIYGNIPKAWCNPAQINQVFMNILANAFEAVDGRSGGKIEISTSARDGKITILIKDNGPGIPREIQGRVFEPFFTTKDVGKGTGLGLSISYGILQQHRGEITVDSAEGRGAAFKITLPVT